MEQLVNKASKEVQERQVLKEALELMDLRVGQEQLDLQVYLDIKGQLVIKVSKEVQE